MLCLVCLRGPVPESFVFRSRGNVVWATRPVEGSDTFLDDLSSTELTTTVDTTHLAEAYSDSCKDTVGVSAMVVFKDRRFVTIQQWRRAFAEADAALKKSTESLADWADKAGALRVCCSGGKVMSIRS